MFIRSLAHNTGFLLGAALLHAGLAAQTAANDSPRDSNERESPEAVIRGFQRLTRAITKDLRAPCPECEQAGQKRMFPSKCERNILATAASSHSYEIFERLYGRSNSSTAFQVVTSAISSKVTAEKTLQGALRGVAIAPSSGLPAPPGYRVAEVFNDANGGGIHADASGVFAALFVPDSPGKPPIFAIKGSVTAQDWAKNITMNVADYLARLARAETANGTKLVDHLARLLSKEAGLVLTGHSQGGALAQSLSALVQARAEKWGTPRGKLHCITQNALGGRPVLADFGEKNPGFETPPGFQNVVSARARAARAQSTPMLSDHRILSRIEMTNYSLPGDPVSGIFPHLGKHLFIPTEAIDWNNDDAEKLALHPLSFRAEQHGLNKVLRYLNKDLSAMRRFYKDRIRSRKDELKSARSPEQQLQLKIDIQRFEKRLRELDAFSREHPC